MSVTTDTDQVNEGNISAVNELLKGLTYREREIIVLRYDFSDGHSYTLEEVARIFKVTRERVRRIEAKAIEKLRKKVEAVKVIPPSLAAVLTSSNK